MAGCEFGDRRLGKRFEKLVSARAGQMGKSFSVACQDWANTKAAHRFLTNERVSEREILAGHFQATRERVAATEGPLLVLPDTSEFSFIRQEKTAIGLLRRMPLQRAFGGQEVTERSGKSAPHCHTSACALPLLEHQPTSWREILLIEARSIRNGENHCPIASSRLR